MNTTATTTAPAAFNLEDLLDGTLDDLPDLPEFKPFPAGAYRVRCTLEYSNEKFPQYRMNIKNLETIEMAKSSDELPAVGAETSISYKLDNEFGQGAFKKILAAAAEKFGAAKNKDLIEQFSGSECLIVTNLRSNKEKTQQYTNLLELKIL